MKNVNAIIILIHLYSCLVMCPLVSVWTVSTILKEIIVKRVYLVTMEV